MAQYTITVQSILKSLAKVKLDLDYDVDFDSPEEFIEETADLLFNKYPIFDEAYRHRLNVKIATHFFFEEINETPYQRWRFKLNRIMNEIMPYYNELYKSTLLEFDPLGDVDYTEMIDRDLLTDVLTGVERDQDILGTRDTDSQRTRQSSLDNTASENTTAKSNQKSWESEAPYNKNSSAKDWASNLTETDESGTNKTTVSGNQDETETTGNVENTQTGEQLHSESKTDQTSESKEDILKTIKGKRSGISMNTLLKEHRDNILNVDMMIIDELQPLFRFILN